VTVKMGKKGKKWLAKKELKVKSSDGSELEKKIAWVHTAQVVEINLKKGQKGWKGQKRKEGGGKGEKGDQSSIHPYGKMRKENDRGGKNGPDPGSPGISKTTQVRYDNHHLPQWPGGQGCTRRGKKTSEKRGEAGK